MTEVEDRREALAAQGRLGWSTCQWSADTELAFLMALRMTGHAKAAATEIGRTYGSVYARRKRNAAFRQRWDEAVAAQQADWIAAQQERLAAQRGEGEGPGGERAPWREVRNGFGPGKRALFLRVLTRTKRVGEACKAAAVSSSTVYAMRARSPRFAAAWEKALVDTPPPSVIEAALARAVDGWDEPIVFGGKVVGQKKRYSDGLLRDLLRAEQARVVAAAAKADSASASRGARDLEGMRARILSQIAAIKRQRGAAADRGGDPVAPGGDWERWKRCWQL